MKREYIFIRERRTFFKRGFGFFKKVLIGEVIRTTGDKKESYYTLLRYGDTGRMYDWKEVKIKIKPIKTTCWGCDKKMIMYSDLQPEEIIGQPLCEGCNKKMFPVLIRNPDAVYDYPPEIKKVKE